METTFPSIEAVPSQGIGVVLRGVRRVFAGQDGSSRKGRKLGDGKSPKSKVQGPKSWRISEGASGGNSGGTSGGTSGASPLPASPASRGGDEKGVVAVEGMDLEIPAGQFLAILGPSGCGKSTLLRLIAGLDQPDAGSISLHDSGAGSVGPAQAYVFQDAHLLPWRSVLKNVELPLELMGVASSHRTEAARQILEQVGLSDALGRYPAQLSGGMRMRVSLARALVTNPRLLLLDEPFAALDEITRQGLDEQLRSLWLSRGMTVLFVTHSIQEAAYLAQRALVLTRRPARQVLDHALDLPVDRPVRLRSQPQFAQQTGILFDALRRGEGQL